MLITLYCTNDGYQFIDERNETLMFEELPLYPCPTCHQPCEARGIANRASVGQSAESTGSNPVK